MARVHVLHSVHAGAHRCVAHCIVPAGNNAVGITWKAALLKGGETGQEPAAYTDETERANLLAGTVAEVPFEFLHDPTRIAAGVLTASLEAEAAGAITAWKREMAVRYNYAGYTQGAVT